MRWKRHSVFARDRRRIDSSLAWQSSACYPRPPRSNRSSAWSTMPLAGRDVEPVTWPGRPPPACRVGLLRIRGPSPYEMPELDGLPELLLGGSGRATHERCWNRRGPAGWTSSAGARDRRVAREPARTDRASSRASRRIRPCRRRAVDGPNRAELPATVRVASRAEPTAAFAGSGRSCGRHAAPMARCREARSRARRSDACAGRRLDRSRFTRAVPSPSGAFSQPSTRQRLCPSASGSIARWPRRPIRRPTPIGALGTGRWQLPVSTRRSRTISNVSAGRARARGGVAAAAAFLARAAELTPDPAQRGGATGRRDGKARFRSARGGTRAPCGRGAMPARRAANRPARSHACRDPVRLSRGGDAPRLLLEAAEQLEPLDGGSAREVYLEALEAAIFAGRLIDGSARTRRQRLLARPVGRSSPGADRSPARRVGDPLDGGLRCGRRATCAVRLNAFGQDAGVDESDLMRWFGLAWLVAGSSGTMSSATT